MDKDALLKGIHWIGHASFRIEDEDTVIYLDPWKVETAIPADLILVTHGHRDHLSLNDIEKIATDATEIVCAESCADQFSRPVHAVQPGDSLTVAGIEIEAVPSYNMNKPNHPKSAGNVGYIITLGGRRIYHAGDTDLIPEFDDIDCEVALLPAGGTYTMDAAEAVEAAGRIKPQVLIPMHWGAIVGSQESAQYVKEHAPEGIAVVVLDPEP